MSEQREIIINLKPLLYIWLQVDEVEPLVCTLKGSRNLAYLYILCCYFGVCLLNIEHVVKYLGIDQHVTKVQSLHSE